MMLLLTILSFLADPSAITHKSYGETAVEYTQNVENLSPPQLNEFIALLPPNGTLLDLGCGSGRDAKKFSDLGFKVTGIDFSPELLEIAKEKAPKAQFLLMDIGSLSLPSQSFDAVWASASLLHLPKDNFPAVLELIQHVLKPGGVFYLSLKKGTGEVLEPDTRYGNMEKFWSYFTENEILAHLEKSGFVSIRISTAEKASAYQTHPWIHAICYRKGHS